MKKISRKKRNRLGRLGEGPLYSSSLLFTSAAVPVAVAVAAGEYPLFGTALNGNGQGFAPMTLLETNLEAAGQMPQEKGYAIKDAGFGVISLASSAGPLGVTKELADVITHGGHLLLRFPQFEYRLGPAWMFPSGYERGASTTFAFDQPYGDAGISNRRKFRQPIKIPPGQTFSLIYTVPRALAVPAAVQRANQGIVIVADFWGPWLSKVAVS